MQKMKVSKKILLSFLVVIMTLCLFAGCSGEDKEADEENYPSGYEGAIEHFIDFYYYYDMDKDDVLAMAPAFFWQRWANNENDGDIEALFEMFEEKSRKIRKERKDELKNITVDYEINYPIKLSDQECQRVEMALEKKHGLNYNEITDGYSFGLTITAVKGDEKKEKDWDIVAVEMDGVWYLATYGKTIMWLVDKVI